MAYTAYRDADSRRWDARQRPTPRPAGVEAPVLVVTRQAAAHAAEVVETEATLLQDAYESSIRAEAQAKRTVESLVQRAATLTRDVPTLRQTVDWARRERDRVAHELDALRQQLRKRETDVETAERQLANALAELEALGDLGGPDA